MLLFQPVYKNIRKIRMILANQLCDAFSIKVTYSRSCRKCFNTEHAPIHAKSLLVYMQQITASGKKGHKGAHKRDSRKKLFTENDICKWQERGKQSIWHYRKGRKENNWKKEAHNLAVNAWKKMRRWANSHWIFVREKPYQTTHSFQEDDSIFFLCG